MGKGSYDGIKLSALGFEVLRLNERRQLRLDKLKSLGYEVCQIDGEWFYRKSGTDRCWTSMDHREVTE